MRRVPLPGWMRGVLRGGSALMFVVALGFSVLYFGGMYLMEVTWCRLGLDSESCTPQRGDPQVPGPVSPRDRGRVPKPSTTYRVHSVHYEPGSHTARATQSGIFLAQIWHNLAQIWHKWRITGLHGVVREGTRRTPDRAAVNGKSPGQRASRRCDQGVHNWHPQRDSNPCRHLERVVS